MPTTVLPATPFQFCWVVDDLAAAERSLEQLHGVTKWLRMPGMRFEREQTLVDGVPTTYDADVSIGYSGSQQIEVIRPVSDDGPYAPWLREHGGGLHHLGYLVDDVDAALATLTDTAGAPYVRGTVGTMMDFAYVRATGLGSFVELMTLSQDIRELFDSLIPDGFVNPWHAEPID